MRYGVADSPLRRNAPKPRSCRSSSNELTASTSAAGREPGTHYQHRWGKTMKHVSFIYRRYKLVKLIITALGVMIMPLVAGAQNVTSTERLHQENLSAQSVAKHHYASPAQRADDDLL